MRTGGFALLCATSPATAQEQGKVAQLEKRVVQLEQRLDKVIDLLEKTADQGINDRLMDQLGPHRAHERLLPLTHESERRGQRAIIPASTLRLLQLLELQEYARTQIGSTHDLFEVGAATAADMRRAPELVEVLESRIALHARALERQVETQRVVVRELENIQKYTEARVQQSLAPPSELAPIRIEVAEARTRLLTLEDIQKRVQTTLATEKPEELGVVVFVNKGTPVISCFSMAGNTKARPADGFERFLVDREGNELAVLGDVEFRTTEIGYVCRAQVTKKKGARDPRVGDRLMRRQTPKPAEKPSK